MRHRVQQRNSSETQIKWTFRLTIGEAVGLMWGVTAGWVVIGLLTPAITQNSSVAICVTMMLVSPTCCLHIGWMVNNQIKRLRIENAPKLDGLLGIATAFAAGRIIERQLYEDRDDIKRRARGSVVYLDEARMRRPVPPTPPEGWSPPEGQSNSGTS